MVPSVCQQSLTLSLPSPCDFFALSSNREPVDRLATHAQQRSCLIYAVFLDCTKIEQAKEKVHFEGLIDVTLPLGKSTCCCCKNKVTSC